jgi:predicted nucleotidyltransferase component of viral defense system
MQGFVLYGGTAIALRLGHRASVDFDFFHDQPLQRESIHRGFGFMEHATVIQDQPNTLTVLVQGSELERTPVKVSFFGDLTFGRVGYPQFTDDGVIEVASLDDLMATKVKVVLPRAESKDYRDIAVMLSSAVSLSKGLAAARLMFGRSFQPSESLKALVYFGDGDLSSLRDDEKGGLVSAVDAVRELPDLEIVSKILSGSHERAH